MTEWEYYQARNLGGPSLSALGANKWELVGITTTGNYDILYVFKRPKAST